MLTIYTFFPILIAALLISSVAWSDWLPPWFKIEGLPLTQTIEFIVFTLSLIWLFSKFERSIIFDAKEQRSIFLRVMISSAASVIFLFTFSMIGFEIDFRELSQQYSLNIGYNIFRILLILFYFGIYGSSKKLSFVLAVGFGFFNVYSGSKSSLLVPILIALMALGRFNFKVVAIIVMVAIAGWFGLIPPHYFSRYLDVGLSAYQTAYLYYVSGVALIDYHLTTVLNALSGVRGYNPVIEYLNDTQLAAGYNLTPTIVGEMMGSGTLAGLTIYCLIALYLKVTRRIWPNKYVLTRRYYAASFFVLLGVMQSTLLDVLFYIVYFLMALAFIRISKHLLASRQALPARMNVP